MSTITSDTRRRNRVLKSIAGITASLMVFLMASLLSGAAGSDAVERLPPKEQSLARSLIAKDRVCSLPFTRIASFKAERDGQWSWTCGWTYLVVPHLNGGAVCVDGEVTVTPSNNPEGPCPKP